MNKIPKGWEVKKLGEIISKEKYSMKRGPFGSALKKEFFVDNGIRVFEQYNPINSDPHWKRYFITKEKFKELEAFKASAGDLLISCSGTLGKILELPKNTEIGIINQALLKIKLDQKQILNSFFIHYFNSNKFQNLILEKTIGTAIKNIASVSELKQLEIPLPPLSEQKAIADKLDDSFAKIENAITNLINAKENLKLYKQSVLKSAFNGDLLPNTSSTHWEVKKLGEICEIMDNQRKPINSSEREKRLISAKQKFPYYGATGQVGFIDDYIFDCEAILLGEDGAPFLDFFKDKAYMVSGKFWVNNHAHILKAKNKISLNAFICYFLNTLDYSPYVSGTTRLKLNQSSMKNIEIPLPPLSEQNLIVAEIDRRFVIVDKTLNLIDKSIQNAKNLKQSILKKAFSGELRSEI
ncbi:restriction endonuclease subunit S [Campylobacter lanienae]|uniref:restriction endonuclease subunit S n=1 Tax=Campylobacter lanienae TaxID=75658 RepID=UPI0021C1E98F|nr:restriction endonuclease subunit S [Campylobacter lanienae]